MAPPSAPQTASIALRLTRILPAPRERVFQAWTSPEALKAWAAPGDMTVPAAEVDLRVGGRYRIRMRAPDGTMHTAAGTYREVDPPKRLVYTWSWDEKPAEGDSLVTVEFHDRGAGRTELVLIHEKFPSDDVRDRHEQGWTGCLVKFAALFPDPTGRKE